MSRLIGFAFSVLLLSQPALADDSQTVVGIWNPDWVGTDQVRSFKVEGKQLQVLTPWRVMPNWADRGMTRSIVTFVRSE